MTIRLLSIEINSECNRKCKWCPNAYFDRKDIVFLDMSIIEKVLKQCVGVAQMNFNNYNEPCMDPRLVDIVRMARRILGPECHIYLNTNGDFLTKELFDALKDAGMSTFNITDYDGNSRIDFAPTNRVQNIRLYNRAGLVKKMGISSPLAAPCPKPSNELVVNYLGQVVLCCSDFLGEVVVGDAKTEAIADIWNSPILQEYREKLLVGNRAGLSLCKDCSFML